jgi:hypothetical protein
VRGINAVSYVFERLKTQSAFPLSGDHRYIFPAYTCFWLFYTVGNSCRGLLVVKLRFSWGYSLYPIFFCSRVLDWLRKQCLALIACLPTQRFKEFNAKVRYQLGYLDPSPIRHRIPRCNSLNALGLKGFSNVLFLD